MAKPDMSRNKDLAGKTVSKGGYNISYNENGYATSAIKTGSKTGKAAQRRHGERRRQRPGQLRRQRI